LAALVDARYVVVASDPPAYVATKRHWPRTLGVKVQLNRPPETLTVAEPAPRHAPFTCRDFAIMTQPIGAAGVTVPVSFSDLCSLTLLDPVSRVVVLAKIVGDGVTVVVLSAGAVSVAVVVGGGVAVPS